MRRFLENALFAVCLAATIGIAGTSMYVAASSRNEDDQQIIDALRAERDEARCIAMGLQAENEILRQIISNEVDSYAQSHPDL